MGVNTLSQRTDGEVINENWFNDIRTSLTTDLVPRNTSGVPTNEGGDLGTTTYQWDSVSAKTLKIDGVDVNPVPLLPDLYRMVSGAANADGSPNFISDAAGHTTTIQGATTPLVMAINGTSYTLSADLTVYVTPAAGAGAAAECLINDINYADAANSEYDGEFDAVSVQYQYSGGVAVGGGISIDTVGSAITAKNGEVALFEVGTEIMLAEINTTAGYLRPLERGVGGTARGTLLNNDKLTLISAGIIIVNKDMTTLIAVTENWFKHATVATAGDLNTVVIESSTGKIAYVNGAGAISYDYMPVGVYGAIPVAGGHFDIPWDYDLNWSSEIDYNIIVEDDDTFRIKKDSVVSVNGERYINTVDYLHDADTAWEGSQVRTLRQNIFIYVKHNSEIMLSETPPRRYDELKKGHYHPLNYYRCVACFRTTTTTTAIAFRRYKSDRAEWHLDENLPIGSIIGINGGHYTSAGNSGYTDKFGAQTDPLSYNDHLPKNWRACDGTVYRDDETIFRGTGKFLPDITHANMVYIIKVK